LRPIELDCTLNEKVEWQTIMDGRGNTELWTTDETQRLIDLAKAGHTSAEICKIIGRSYGAISTKATGINLQFKGGRSPTGFDPSLQKDRLCMTCRSPMISEWIGNRICEECKETDAWRYA